MVTEPKIKVVSEEVKDAGRTTIFGAVAVVVAYLVNLVLPQAVPPEVRTAILTLTLAGAMYVVTYIDSKIHRSDSKLNGLLPF